MPTTLDPKLKRALADRIRYYNELGIYDFYRRDVLPRAKHLSKSSQKSETNCPELNPRS